MKTKRKNQTSKGPGRCFFLCVCAAPPDEPHHLFRFLCANSLDLFRFLCYWGCSAAFPAAELRCYLRLFCCVALTLYWGSAAFCWDVWKFRCANYLDLFGFLCANCLDLFRLFDNERYLMKFRTTNSLSPLMYFARNFILHKLTATPIGWNSLSVTRSKKQKSKAIK